MEHEEAVKTKASERYMLGEMSESEAESFEDHYFDCSVCANDIRDEMKVLEWGREIAKGQSASVSRISRRRFTQWIPLAAAAALVVGLGLPMAMRSDEGPSASAGQSFALHAGASRGQAENVFKVAPGETLIVAVDVPVGEGSDFSTYDATIRDAAGKTPFDPMSSPASRVVDDGTFELVLRDLPAGTYEVTIEGVRKDGKRSTVVEQSFTVQY